MFSSYIYVIVIVVIAMVVIFGIFLFIKSISNSDKYYRPKNIKRKIEELEKKIAGNPRDYDSMYDLAVIQEQYNFTEKSIETYKKLIDAGYFEGEEIAIYQKLEALYQKLDNNEEVFKCILKIAQLDPKNNYYSLKAANILGKEGAYKIACEYFDRILNNKGDFEIDELKIAALCYFINHEYKKIIIMLEELHKRLSRNISHIEDDFNEMVLVEKILISLYIATDEINNAKKLAETILSSRYITTDRQYRFFINRIYLYILYKANDTKEFIELHEKLSSQYKVNEIDKEEISIILDFAFYNYFIKDINSASSYFEHIRLFNAPEFDMYDLDGIFAYLSEVAKAQEVLQNLRNNMELNNDEKYKNENYEKYVDEKYVEIWENSVKLWENSFNNIEDIINLVQIEHTMDIEKILSECNINEDNATLDNLIIKKVDKIFDITLSSFKSVCQDIIQKKLMYSAVQEYNDHLIDYDYGDEVNYLAFASNKSKKDLTLISFKRWRNTEVGELIIRDFILLVNESGAKNGILILPVELTNSAKSYATHNNKIRVYTRNQFNYMLRDSKL